jgi:hypothetical protein
MICLTVLLILHFGVVESDHPIVYDYSRIDPSETIIQEEHEGPLAFAVQELLSAHLSVKLALEKKEIGIQRDVNDVFSSLCVLNDKFW